MKKKKSIADDIARALFEEGFPDDYLEELQKLNGEIQEFVSSHGVDLPEALIQLLSSLDWLVVNWTDEER